MNDIRIITIDGSPAIDTATIANVCRNGKTNNVYRMAIRLAERGQEGIYPMAGKPLRCVLTQKAWQVLATKFYRHKDEATAMGILAINNAFDAFMNTIVDDIIFKSADNAIAATAKMICAPRVAEITKDITAQFADVMNGEIPDVQIEEISFEDASIELKMGCRVNKYIRESQKRINHYVEVMFDALRDTVRDMMEDVETAIADKQAECDALRSELDALKRMLKPAPAPDKVQPLNGNISVHQCAAWLTSNGIKGMGEIRLYEWMRQKGLVCANGTSRNLPTQIALEKGLLVSVSNPYTHPHTGERMNAYTTRVTPKGQQFLFNRLMYYQTNP